MTDSSDTSAIVDLISTETPFDHSEVEEARSLFLGSDEEFRELATACSASSFGLLGTVKMINNLASVIVRRAVTELLFGNGGGVV